MQIVFDKEKLISRKSSDSIFFDLHKARMRCAINDFYKVWLGLIRLCELIHPYLSIGGREQREKFGFAVGYIPDVVDVDLSAKIRCHFACFAAHLNISF